jgi:hypothetical protein
MPDKRPKQPNNNAKSIERWDDEGGAPSGGRVTGKHPKRPRDLNQFAKRMVDLATGNADEPNLDAGKSPAAVARGRAGGEKGGMARATKLTPEQRAEIARVAAQTRWKKSPD